jgi:hypothetical protein
MTVMFTGHSRIVGSSCFTSSYFAFLAHREFGGKILDFFEISWALDINILSFITRDKYYRCADKSLVRPGRKKATVTEDFLVHISYL